MTVNKPTQENFLKRGSPGQCLKGLALSEPQTDGDTKQILTKKKMHRREAILHGP